MSDWFTIHAQTSGIADVEITGLIEAGAAQQFLARLPPRLLECARCSAVTLTREARCGRCGWREGT